MKSIIAICLILGFVGTTYAALATEALSTNSAGTFLKGPVVVLSASSANSNTTDYKAWGNGNTNGASSAMLSYLGSSAKFYPGTDNGTIWLTAMDVGTSTTAAYFITRKISALTVINGTNTAAEEAAVSGSGAISGSVTYVGTPRASMAYGTAVGAYLFVTAETDGTKKQDYLQLYTIVAGASTLKTIATSSATVAWTTGTPGPGADGLQYAFAPLAVWGEDGGYYVVYESQLSTVPKTAASASGTATLTSLGIYLQGYNSSGVVYTTPPQVSAAITAPTTFGTSMGAAVGGGSNFTNSTMWLISAMDVSANKLVCVTIGHYTGTVSTIATLTTSGSAATLVTYSLGGIVPSANNGTYGFIVGYSTGATTPTYNLSILLNGSATLTNLGFTLGTPTAIPTGYGYRYSTGFAAVAIVKTSTTAVSYSGLVFNNNGTQNTTAASTQANLGSYNPNFPPSIFIDVNGSLWFGFGTVDTANNNNIVGASIAQVAANVNAYYPSAGSALATIAALLSFVIASLFMF